MKSHSALRLELLSHDSLQMAQHHVGDASQPEACVEPRCRPTLPAASVAGPSTQSAAKARGSGEAGTLSLLHQAHGPVRVLHREACSVLEPHQLKHCPLCRQRPTELPPAAMQVARCPALITDLQICPRWPVQPRLEPDTDSATEQNEDMDLSRRRRRLLPEVGAHHSQPRHSLTAALAST